MSRRLRPVPVQAPRVEPPDPPAGLWWLGRGYAAPPKAEIESVERVLDAMKRGDYRIPPFQRKYVWTDDHVVTLLDSMLRGHHIGTILTWERRDLPPGEGSFGGVTIPLREDRGELVIDGQQRLGALARAFFSDRFSCDLLTGTFLVDAPPAPWRAPLGLFHNYLALLDWSHGRFEERRTIWALWERLFRSKVAIVHLSEDRTLAQVVETFRRLNSTGVPMPPEDLERILRPYVAGQFPESS